LLFQFILRPPGIASDEEAFNPTNGVAPGVASIFLKNGVRFAGEHGNCVSETPSVFPIAMRELMFLRSRTNPGERPDGSAWF